MSGSPPLDPPLPVLTALSETIQTSIKRYESATTPAEKGEALRTLQSASAKLSKATTPPGQQFRDLVSRHNVNVAIRIAIEMGLFNILPRTGELMTLRELAGRTNSQESFLLRITRTLSTFDVLKVTVLDCETPAYSHTPLSRLLAAPIPQAMNKHLFDTVMRDHCATAGTYYTKFGFKDPEGSRNCAFTYAHGLRDANFFDVLQTLPDELAVFNEAMMIATMGLTEVVSSYPFDQLKSNEDGVVLVDVGGGKGHVIKELINIYPSVKGKVVLQDLKVVLEGGTVVNESEAALQPYNFFEEIQPVKGMLRTRRKGIDAKLDLLQEQTTYSKVSCTTGLTKNV
jgi:hypothetical protein